MMDGPQSTTSQNIFQVEEQPEQVSSPPPIGQGAELAPSFVPPDESTISEMPAGSGGGIIRLVIILVVIILVVGAVLFLLNFLKNKSSQITLTYWGLWEDEAVMQPLIDEYQKQNPNVTVKYTLHTPKTYRDRLAAAVGRGEVDLFRFHNTWVPMLKEELASLPENIMAKKEYETTFYPIFATDLKLGQNYIGIPLMYEGLALFYNEDILNASGKKVPATWDELYETAKTLTVKTTTGEIKTAGVALGTVNNVEHFSDIVALMFLQNGVNLRSPAGADAAEALTFYHMFAQKPDNTWDEAQPNSIVAFASGKTAMIFAPSWQVLAIQARNPNLKFKTAPVPQLPGVNISWASYWAEGVSATSKNQKEAWKFLKFLSSEDSLTKLYALQTQQGRSIGELYPRSDMAQLLKDHPLAGAFILQAPQAKSFYLASETHDEGINDHLIKYLEDAINSMVQGGSAEAALTTTASGFQQVLAQYGLK